MDILLRNGDERGPRPGAVAFDKTPPQLAPASRPDTPFKEQIVCCLALASDVCAIIIAATLSFYVRFSWSTIAPETYILALVATMFLVLLAFHKGCLYEFETIAAWPRWSGKMVAMAMASALLLVASMYLLKVADEVSRFWLVATFCQASILLWVLRGLIAAIVCSRARRGGFTKAVAVVGAGPQGQQLIGRLRKDQACRKRVVGVFDERRTRVALPAHIPVFGDLERLESEVRRGTVDEIVIALPWSADSRIVALLDRLRELPVNMYLGSDMVAHCLPAHQSDLFGDLPALLLVRQPLSGWNGIVKWLMDKIFATIALVILAPLMLVIAAAIRIESPGPILFRQKRYGFNIGPITVYKFRSMLHEPASGSFRQATRNDSRVTQVGRFLRWTSIDELPQLFNVVNGTMSLVGPRPHPVELDEQFAALIDGYKGRHRIRPGITGWAQINGLRGETKTVEAMRARIEHDLYYIENWSLLLDLRILTMTVLGGWVGPNAY